ncbi:MAG: glutamate synthase large subunit, partial [Spirochaetia bacterium]|nr:glutamate synthase large subunit [Spirochaetia bacterium]
NTLRGNMGWMRARESQLESDLFSSDELTKIKPIIDENGSDSAMLDNVAELLVLSGRSIPHVMMMLIPEAWAKDKTMDKTRRAFYEYHATFQEPWDGPASVAFTDGKMIGATLDRNGLRPSRYCLTEDNILVMGSEAGALDIPADKIVLKGRLQPGKMFLADLEEGRIISDEEIKEKICATQPYEEWIRKEKVELKNLQLTRAILSPNAETILKRQKLFGFTQEDLRIIIKPMMENAEEAIGSMGTDTPLAILSDRSQNLYNYFYQLFAQVTNPPIDPIREETVMSLISFVGHQGNLLKETPEHCHLIELPQPILTNADLERLRWVDTKGFQARTIPIVFQAEEGLGNLQKVLARVKRKVSEAIDEGYKIVVLSDKPSDSGHAPIPALLAVSAVHHHLLAEGTRTRCALIVETGEAREIHHFALLLGYGASAVNPFNAFDTIHDLREKKLLDTNLSYEESVDNYIYAINKGLLKIMSKMGISTLQSYIGAQLFEAVGLSEELVNECFPGTVSRVGGMDIHILEKETLLRHRFAYPEYQAEHSELDPGGHYQWRQRGEKHLFNPKTIHKLHHAAQTGNYEIYKEFAQLVNDQSREMYTLRGLLHFANYAPIPIEEVEPLEKILPRFATGGMSFGSISEEAHTTLAIAMNRIGAKSNTGEGGEDPARFKPLPNGDSARSAIKQVASGRFGVTMNYLTNAAELQIKVAQGAKPGEGGQLPGKKVDKHIARIRYSTPGVGLISPPPHHDIYSIEDLAQLIYDLKNANPDARVSVKLVSEAGVGTIAAGVAKAHADVVLIAGVDGGTGASPLTSIKHAGLPWELGLAESHQVLVKNKLRDRIVVQADGMLRTGRDIAIATLLGAEEWGIATAALVATGCVMMRKCHLNTCPVGIATQDPELRKLFTGRPEDVVNYFTFVATELREIMAQLGFRTIDEMVGRVDKLKAPKEINHWKAQGLDLSRLFEGMDAGLGNMHCSVPQNHHLEKALDHELIALSKQALEPGVKGKKVLENLKIRNVNRTVGTLLSHKITKLLGEAGLPEDSLRFRFVGSAGQSFGAFAVPGLTLELEGEANDYFGKGLSGGKLILYPPEGSKFIAHENVIVGNVAFYGATSGEAYIRGLAGERFCVRNSGVHVVVDSIGDHGCEYMTGGRVTILGEIGKNFAAGMSGGIAYLWDPKQKMLDRINMSMVELEKLDEEDERYLSRMIQRYIQHTGSVHSKRIIAEWDKTKTEFIKVMPKEYKKALLEIGAEKSKEAAESGRKIA